MFAKYLRKAWHKQLTCFNDQGSISYWNFGILNGKKVFKMPKTSALNAKILLISMPKFFVLRKKFGVQNAKIRGI